MKSLLIGILVVGLVSTHKPELIEVETINRAPVEMEETVQPQELSAIDNNCFYTVDNSFYSLTGLRDDK